jgi:fused signal recognition particle receptor
LGIFKSGLAKTRQAFLGRISQILGNTEINEETWEDLESILLSADVGVPTTEALLESLQARTKREGLTRVSQLREVLKEELMALLIPPPPLNLSGRALSVMLVVGVNGSGKTTSIGKLARRMQLNNRRVLVAAGDTFRAAAVDQLQIWAERAGVDVVAGKPNSDPAAVVYDALKAAQARQVEVLIVDTAGRLHSNFNLMQELEKIRKVITSAIPDAPHETLLVLDGTTGQNALLQAQKFTQAANVTGLIITKLDGTAKGGMVFAIQKELGLPIHYVGLGEKIEDLVFFEPRKFVDSLFSED